MAKDALASGGASSSKSLLFMMAAMTCGVCVLLGGGLMMASRVIHALALRSSTDKSTVRTPLGDYRLEKAAQVGPGLPVYPQASLMLPGTEAARVSEQNTDQPQVVSSVYHTNSSREYVANWYAEHLSPEFARQDAGPKKLPDSFRSASVSDDDIAFVGERGDQIRVVALANDEGGGGTKITLLRSAKPAVPQSADPQNPPAQNPTSQSSTSQ
ncbi:MAG TPA: hypothetical protein VE263_13745 [Candidatus Angelobacter sp.]|nr:hypothetical protein [Candidatus Angelobacter sp.]